MERRGWGGGGGGGGSGGSRNFKTGVRGPGAAELLGSGDCLNAPSHIPYVIAVRAKKKIHNVHIAR